MACNTNYLYPLGRGCVPQIGGIKYIYLVSASPVNNAHGPSVRLIDGDYGFNRVDLGLGLDENTNAPVLGFLAVDSDDNILDTTASFLDRIADAEPLNPASLDANIVRIDIPRQGAVMTSEAQVNRENGTLFYKNSVTIPTLGLTIEALGVLRQLEGAGVIVIAETYDGRFNAFGFKTRARIESANVTTGGAFGDNPGETIVLSAEESTPIAADLVLLDDDFFIVARRDTDLVQAFHRLAWSA